MLLTFYHMFTLQSTNLLSGTFAFWSLPRYLLSFLEHYLSLCYCRTGSGVYA